MTQSQTTMITADRSGMNQRRKVSPEDQDGNSALMFEDQSAKSPMNYQQSETQRQSRTSRLLHPDFKQNSKMVYYDINNRLKPALPGEYEREKNRRSDLNDRKRQ